MHDDDDTSPAEEKFFDGDELTELAVAAAVTGEAGALGSAWLKPTPDVSVAGTSGDYQVSALEVARAHGFTKEALAQVERLTSTDDSGSGWLTLLQGRPCRLCSPPFSMLCSLLANSAYRMQAPSPRSAM